MKYGNLFVSSEFPERLSNKETLVLFDRMKHGDMEAREELINRNIELVIQYVNNSFKDSCYDKEELVAVGCLGLIKGIDNFDILKHKYFSTHIGNYIHIQIDLFIRKLNKDNSVIGFDHLIKNGIRLKDVLLDEVSIEERYEEKEHRDYMYRLLEEGMGCLSERNIEIIKLYFGFYDKKYTCRELAKMYNISISEISALVIRSLKRVKDRMEEMIMIDKLLMDVSDNTLKRSKNN